MARIVLILALALVAVKGNEEAELMKSILAGYPEMARFARPVNDVSEALAVDISLTAIKIVDFVEKGGYSGYGTLTVAGWFLMTWNDANVGWNPEEYAGISKLTIPTEVLKSRFWVPDIVPYDGTPWADRVQETDAVAFSNGLMILVPAAIFKFDCTPDHGGNTTACTTTFGSWTHDGYLLDIGEEPTFDISELAVHPDWIVLGAEATRHVRTYPCCPEPYPSVTFTLNLQSAYGPFIHLHQEVPEDWK